MQKRSLSRQLSGVMTNDTSKTAKIWKNCDNTFAAYR